MASAGGCEGGAGMFDEVGGIVRGDEGEGGSRGSRLAVILVASNHDGLGEVEGGMAHGIGNGDEVSTEGEVIVGEAVGFGAEDGGGGSGECSEGETDEFFDGECGDEWGAAWAGGETADESAAVGGLGERAVDLGVGEDIEGAMCEPAGGIGEGIALWADKSELGEPHGFEGARSSADVSGLARLNEDDAHVTQRVIRL